MTEGTGGQRYEPDAGQRYEPDAGFAAARRRDDYVEAARELLPLTVWLPVRGPEQRYLVAHRGGGSYVRAYTRPAALTAIASPDVHPELARPHRFGELLRGWRSTELGLVVNPDSDTEFRIPADVIPEMARLRQARPFEHLPGQSAPESQEAPEEIGGFRFVAIVDGFGEDGRPVVAPERGTVADPEERRRIRAYLDAGPAVQVVNGQVTDLFEPERGAVVPAHSRTDGRWIWSDAVAYYLDRYGLAPEPEFYRTIREREYACPAVTEATLQSAGRALEEWQFIAADVYRRTEDDGD